MNPWTIAHQAPLSMKFSRQEYWSGLPFPSPGDLPNPGIKPKFPALLVASLLSEPPRKSCIVYGPIVSLTEYYGEIGSEWREKGRILIIQLRHFYVSADI